MEARKSVRLTKEAVESLVGDPAGNRFYRVAPAKGICQGLCIQVTKAGAKSFVIRYRFHGRQKIYTLGRFPSMTPDRAKKEAISVWDKINRGEDPNEEKRKARKAALRGKTVGDLCKAFRTDYLNVKCAYSTRLLQERRIDDFILPALGKIPVDDVSTADIAKFLKRIADKTPTQANGIQSLLHKMFKLAILWEYRSDGLNPIHNQERAKENPSRERHLSDAEIAALGAALRRMESVGNSSAKGRPKGGENPFVLAAIRLYLLTAMRRSELVGDHTAEIPALRWDGVDTVERIAVVHNKKGGKSGKKRPVMLCSAAIGILDRLPHLAGNPHVIPGQGKGSFANMGKAWERIKTKTMAPLWEQAKKAGMEKPTIDISDVILHDLRRSFSSLGTRMGYPKTFMGALLGHGPKDVTDIYTRASGGPLWDAVEDIGSRMWKLLSGEIDVEKERQERLSRRSRPGKLASASFPADA